MSLRHLYKDLNELGVYPDLIESNRSGEMKMEVYRKGTGWLIYSNKYYGEINMTNDGDTYMITSRFMFIGDKDGLKIYSTRSKLVITKGDQRYIMEPVMLTKNGWALGNRMVNLIVDTDLHNFLIVHQRHITSSTSLLILLNEFMRRPSRCMKYN